MQKRRNVVILVMAVLFGLIGVYFVMLYVMSHTGNVTEVYTEQPTTAIVVAAQDIPENVRIKKNMLRMVNVLTEYVLPQTFTNIDDVVEAMTMTTIYKGEQILDGRISRGETPNEFAYRIPEGKRAISFSINSVSAVSGFIQPSDKVDILLTMSAPGAMQEMESEGGTASSEDDELQAAWTEQLKYFQAVALEILDGRRIVTLDGENITFTLFQNIEVLAIGKRLVRAQEGEDTGADAGLITLCLSPQEAELITNAETVGSFKYTLRNPGDNRIVELTPLV